ncbi:MAG: hypothetical protein ABEJ82_05240 [Haloplanus sp.]
MRHPSDPLTAEEITETRDTFEESEGVSDESRYTKIDLDEPPKKTVLEYDENGGDIERKESVVQPGENVEACARYNSSVVERSGFIDNHLWATPFRDDERVSAGEYPNQSSGGEELPEWTSEDRSIDRENIVLCYPLGVNHVGRPEDWPVLPVHLARFKLGPVNFVDESPTVDVPPEHKLKDIQACRSEKCENPGVSRTQED